MRDHFITKEISVGDYVLSGGELGAAILCDAVIRLIPGVLGNETSALWDDARRKMVSISPAGKSAREAALAAMAPVISEMVEELGAEKVRAALPVLRELRLKLEAD